MLTSNRNILLRIFRGVVITIMGLGILGGALYVTMHLLLNPQRPEQSPPVQEVPLVDVTRAEFSDEIVIVKALGTVVPANTVTLKAQVNGRIVALHPEFMEGGIVGKGDLLVKIDARDYELVLERTRTQVEEMEANLIMEHGYQEVARHEWEHFNLNEQSSELEEELALRKPQLRKLEANLQSTRIQVEQSLLDIQRTEIKSPVNAVVQQATLRVGDLVTAQQTELARLIGTDVYWAQASISVNDLHWIQFPDHTDSSGSQVQIRTQSGDIREGRVLKLLSDIEENGLLARILVEIKDPLNLTNDNSTGRPLLLGERIQIEIHGSRLDNVVVLPRFALRNGNDVWIVDDNGKLDMLYPDIVWRGDEFIFCRGITQGIDIIVSNLAAPVEGMALQVILPEHIVKDDHLDPNEASETLLSKLPSTALVEQEATGADYTSQRKEQM